MCTYSAGRTRLLAFGACTLVTLSLTGHAAEYPVRTPGLGQPLTAEMHHLDLTVLPDGDGLPAGEGRVADGKTLYAAHCLRCHGPDGAGGTHDRLVGGAGTLTSARPVKTVGSYWPYATTVFDYIRRAMPFETPGSLDASEVYALTAWLLHANGIVKGNFVADAQSLPAVRMPNRDNFVSEAPGVGDAEPSRQ